MRLAGGDHAGAQRNFSGWASTVNPAAPHYRYSYASGSGPMAGESRECQRHHIVAGGSPGPGAMLRDPAVLQARYGLCAGSSPVVFLLRWRRRSASHEAAAKTGAAIPARSAAPVNALSRNRPRARRRSSSRSRRPSGEGIRRRRCRSHAGSARASRCATWWRRAAFLVVHPPGRVPVRVWPLAGTGGAGRCREPP